MKTASRSTVLLAGLAGSALALSACTGGGTGGMQPPAGQVAAALRLVSFDSCDDALAELKSAVAEHVTPYGLGGDDVTFDGGFAMAVPEAAAAGERGSLATGGADDSAGVTAPQEYSTTNTHEIGVDEPDLVKTDGRRIVTVTGNTLRVIDTESRILSGELDLTGRGDMAYSEQMLLSGDRALVIGYGMDDFVRTDPWALRPRGQQARARRPVRRPRGDRHPRLRRELRRRAPGRLDRPAGRPLRTSAELDLPGCDVPSSSSRRG